MSAHALALESEQIAVEVHAFLKALEPARWREELEPALRERLESIRERLHELLERYELPDTDAALASLRERLDAMRQVINEAEPAREQAHAQWNELRVRLLPAYEAVAASLKVQQIHVPSLRPSNYTRNIFHVMGGLVVLTLIHVILPQTWLVWVAGAVMVMGWSMELGRRQSTKVNNVLMKLFGAVAHPHERYRVNSSTWYTTALWVLAAWMPMLAISLAVVVLAFSDPMAAIIGRRFGRRTLIAGRTVEGTGAFVVTGLIVSMAVMAIFYAELTTAQMMLYAVGAVVPGAIAELVSERVDDNFSIPMAVGLGVTLTGFLMAM